MVMSSELSRSYGFLKHAGYSPCPFFFLTPIFFFLLKRDSLRMERDIINADDIDLGQSEARVLGLLLAHGSRALAEDPHKVALAFGVPLDVDFFFCYELPTSQSCLL